MLKEIIRKKKWILVKIEEVCNSDVVLISLWIVTTAKKVSNYGMVT